MRIIARSTLRRFADTHPEAASAIGHWESIARRTHWATMADIQKSFAKAKALNADRIRFEIAGGSYRMVCAVDFERQVIFVKFIGSHAEYDRIDALTVADY